MPTIQNRRATAAQWTAANPVLAAGEIGFELDTNALKVGDGLTPWETLPYLSDESLKTLVESGRLSEDVLNDTYATKGDLDNLGGGTPATPGFEALGAKIAFGGLGQHTIAVASDSTANDGNDWVRLWQQRLAAMLPTSTRCVYHGWNNTTGAWGNNVDKEGEGTPASDGLRLRDTFTNARAELIGTTPEVGPAWLGPLGGWKVENGVAKNVTSDFANTAAVNVGTSEGALKVAVRLNLVNTGTASQQFRFHMGAPQAGGAGLWVGVASNGSGSAQFHLYVSSPSSREVATVQVPSLTPYNNQGWTEFNIELTRSIQNVTLKITLPNGTSATTTGTITEAESASMSQANTGHVVMMRNGAALLDRIEVNSIEFQGAPTSASGDLFEVWNGAIGGAGAPTFDSTKRGTMWGGKHIDTLIVGFGHNNGSQTGEAFAAQIEAFVNDWRADHPETKYVIITSQNPQFAPAANPEAHAARQMAVRLLARRKGWDYIPVFEAFSAQPDGGLSLMWPDGVHPSAAESAPYDRAGYGQPFWADVAERCVLDRR